MQLTRMLCLLLLLSFPLALSADDDLKSHRNALSELMKQAGDARTAEKLDTDDEPVTPAEVAEDIAKEHRKAAEETGKLLADPLNYEEPTNPNSQAIADAAEVDDSLGESITVPEVNYAEFLNTKSIRKFKKHSDLRIAVPVYRVAFCVQTKASAQALAGLDRDRGSVNASMIVSLAGVDGDVMQQIANRAYQDYLTRLSDKGFDVVPFDEIKASEGYQKVNFVDGLYSKNMWGTAFAVVTPEGMPLFWEPGNPMGNVGFGMGQAFNRMSTELNATVILPTLVINFAEMSSSGRSFFAHEAEVGAEMGITLNNMTSQHLRIGHPKVSTAIVFMGDTRLEDPVSIAGNFGQMVQGDGGYNDQALMGLLSRGMGTALSSSVRESRVVQANPRAYQSLSLQALATGNQMFADALADARDGIKPSKKKKR